MACSKATCSASSSLSCSVLQKHKHQSVAVTIMTTVFSHITMISMINVPQLSFPIIRNQNSEALKVYGDMKQNFPKSIKKNQRAQHQSHQLRCRYEITAKKASNVSSLPVSFSDKHN